MLIVPEVKCWKELPFAFPIMFPRRNFSSVIVPKIRPKTTGTGLNPALLPKYIKVPFSIWRVVGIKLSRFLMAIVSAEIGPDLTAYISAAAVARMAVPASFTAATAAIVAAAKQNGVRTNISFTADNEIGNKQTIGSLQSIVKSSLFSKKKN